MKKIYFAILLSAVSMFFLVDAAADPANPRPFRYTQPDGSTIMLVLHGDEFYNWTTDTGGRVMVMGEDGFYRRNGATSASIRSTAAEMARARRQAFKREFTPRDITPKGTKKFLIMLVEFSDLKFTVDSPGKAFDDLANMNGYSANGSIGSISDYYYQNSYGAFKPTFDVVGPITLNKGSTDFPEDDKSEHFQFARESFLEALQVADDKVDYTKYDLDNDGYIDNIYFIYPGEAQSNGGGPKTIWPHAWGFSGDVLLDGKRPSSYACSSELVKDYSSGTLKMCGIGTICHEFGHVIGLPDTYDTDYADNGSALNPGSYSLMSGGNHNNGGYIPCNITAFEKSLLGWMEIPLLAEGKITLPDLGTNPSAGYIPTNNEGEWFVFETRDGQGWDKSLPPGLVIYHLDRSQNLSGGKTAEERWRYGDGINEYSDHPCYYPLTPSGDYRSDSDVPWPGSQKVTEHTFKAWSGDKTGYALKDIAFSNSQSTFTLDYNFLKITGTVKDNYGNPLSGVTISVAPAQAGKTSTRGIRRTPRPASNISKRAQGSSVSNSNGVFEISFEKEGDTYEVLASKDNYISYVNKVSFGGEEKITLDVVLKKFITGGSTTLSKHNNVYYTSWGFEGLTAASGAVRFSPEELEEHVGKKLSAVDFFVTADTAEKIYIIVDVDGERVIFHEVDLSTMNWTGWTRVDITEENFEIPEGKTLHIGYGIINGDYSYPWASDNGPAKEGGFCYYSDVLDTAHEWWDGEELGANLLIGAELTSPSVVDGQITVLDIGINYIQPLPSSIKKGDTLTLTLVKSPSNSPRTVMWFCDDEQCSASTKAKSGHHTIKAVLGFKDGHTETVETRYYAQ